MATVTVRDIPDEIYRALQVDAAKHGNSVETEILNILENAIINKQHLKLGSMLAEIGQQARLRDE